MRSEVCSKSGDFAQRGRQDCSHRAESKRLHRNQSAFQSLTTNKNITSGLDNTLHWQNRQPLSLPTLVVKHPRVLIALAIIPFSLKNYL